MKLLAASGPQLEVGLLRGRPIPFHTAKGLCTTSGKTCYCSNRPAPQSLQTGSRLQVKPAQSVATTAETESFRVVSLLRCLCQGMHEAFL